MLKVISYQIADAIDIKLFKAAFTGEIYYADADELFYHIGKEKFIYVFKYGIVSFLGYNEVEMTAFIQVITPYCKNIFDYRLSEQFDIETNARQNKLGFNKIELETTNAETFRLIM